jgi:hypothetical protein
MRGLRTALDAPGNRRLNDLKGWVPSQLADSRKEMSRCTLFGDQQYRWSRAAKRNSIYSFSSGQWQKARQQGASLHTVRLVDTILHRRSQQISSMKRKCGDQQSGRLNICDRICAGILIRQQCTRLAGRKAG